MRCYILDDVVDPVTGENLSVEPGCVIQREGPAVPKCTRWCGYRGCAPAAVTVDDCRACQHTWIVSGELVGQQARYPVLEGIPRLLPRASTAKTLDHQTQESFGYEWERFDRVLADYADEAQRYFGIVPPSVFEGAVALDAGCGMGRWALYVSDQPVRRLYAVDFSRAIDRAAQILAGREHVHCLQADICALPFRPSLFDFVYSLGVLHHLVAPDEGMQSLVKRLKRDGALLMYLYYALDNRPAYFRWLLWCVTQVRRLTARLPKPVMYALAWFIGILVYWPLARLAHLLDLLGFERLAALVPLQAYSRRSLRMMVTDAFDRFATPLEKRYSREQIRIWLDHNGLMSRFSESIPYWVALATWPR